MYIIWQIAGKMTGSGFFGGEVGKRYLLFELRDGHYRFYIFSPDHGPPHVHIRSKSGDRSVVIAINTSVVRKNKGFDDEELGYMKCYVELRRAHILKRWDDIQHEED